MPNCSQFLDKFDIYLTASSVASIFLNFPNNIWFHDECILTSLMLLQTVTFITCYLQMYFITNFITVSVGLASKPFVLTEDKQFCIVPGYSINGVAPATLKRYLKDLLFCGSCYRALSHFVSPENNSSHTSHGYIFAVSVNFLYSFVSQCFLFIFPAASVSYLYYFVNSNLVSFLFPLFFPPFSIFHGRSNHLVCLFCSL